MTDIVERIKDAENATHALFNHIFQDAREEIERLRIENETLRAEVIHIKEVEFPRKAQAVSDGWRGKCERLEAKIAEMEKQEPVGVLHVGSYYGEELEDWEFEADQRVCDRLNERHVTNPTSLKLYALPGAQGEEK